MLLDAESGAVRRIIALQYNPDTLTRSYQVKGTGAESGDRSEALRLKGPAVETIKLECEVDATDQLESADGTATQVGLHPQLAVLEGLVHPPTSRILANRTLADRGELEIVPMQSPLAVLVWSRSRITPVRITELSITEEAFDPNLNPIRARVSLGLRVLSVDDLGFQHRGGSLFLDYLQQREQLATRSAGAGFGALGISGIP